LDLSQSSAKRFFAEHAQDYSRSQSHAQGADLGALIGALKPKKSEVALDVATGTGFTAVALAGAVGHVTGIDVTDEMLVQAGRLARETGRTNVRFELGDALKIGYPNSSFDIVTTRRATHHFENVPRFLREARRVLRSGGRLGIVDMSPPEGAEAFSNRIERLRDRSHVRAFTQAAWESMASKAGLRIQSSEILEESVTFERWLYPVEAGGREEQAIRRAWGSAPANVKRLLGARFEKGAVQEWRKSRIVLVASKTP
jgi:ubiquinone/menaquinone biosynthesis C-methylase UbiE